MHWSFCQRSPLFMCKKCTTLRCDIVTSNCFSLGIGVDWLWKHWDLQVEINIWWILPSLWQAKVWTEHRQGCSKSLIWPKRCHLPTSSQRSSGPCIESLVSLQAWYPIRPCIQAMPEEMSWWMMIGSGFRIILVESKQHEPTKQKFGRNQTALKYTVNCGKVTGSPGRKMCQTRPEPVSPPSACHSACSQVAWSGCENSKNGQTMFRTYMHAYMYTH